MAMLRSPQRPLSHDRALACVTLNFALSGLGSLKAGRIFTGVGQLVTVFGGFFLLCAWLLEWIYRIFQTQIGGVTSPPPPGWLWKWGVAGFVVSYSWMLLTCASLMRKAKANEKQIRQNIPPRLTDLPKQNSENP
jgi:hypothetical protein